MTDLPRTAGDYTREDLRLVRSGCLEMAVRFGDLLDDLVIVGGLVPTLLIDMDREQGADREPNGRERYISNRPGSDERDTINRHVGTRDLDLGFAIALLDEERYKEISQRLRTHGFEPDTNEDGNLTTHRWKYADQENLTIDFLIPPVGEDDQGGHIKNLETDFSAIVVPGLELAFEDLERVEMSGRILNGSTAKRTLPVCGPGAFVVLKALAWNLRGLPKDAYDLFYVVFHYGDGPHEIADRMQQFLDAENAETNESIHILKRDFDENDTGPTAVSEFVHGHGNDAPLKADVSAFVADLVRHLDL